jgi:ATP-dependent protease ClpP protease subunit
MKQKPLLNRNDRKFLAAKTNNTLTLFVYDIIGQDLFGDGVTAQAVAQKLTEAGDLDSIILRINSPGGDLFEAVAIKNLIASKNVSVTVYVDGEASSAASIIMLVGDKIVMGEGSTVFVHNALTFAGGNASDFRKMADDLEKISGEMAQMYATRTGLAINAVQALMDAETILTAQEAVDKHFADEIAKPKVDIKTVDDTSPRAMSREQFEHELLAL